MQHAAGRRVLRAWRQRQAAGHDFSKALGNGAGIQLCPLQQGAQRGLQGSAAWQAQAKAEPVKEQAVVLPQVGLVLVAQQLRQRRVAVLQEQVKRGNIGQGAWLRGAAALQEQAHRAQQDRCRGGACVVCSPQMLLQVEQEGQQRSTCDGDVAGKLRAKLVQGGN